jgi:hypothetical protein
MSSFGRSQDASQLDEIQYPRMVHHMISANIISRLPQKTTNSIHSAIVCGRFTL